eukprot:scaffold17789_cov112-Isochrysis_galbana.AAC.4
MAASRSGCVPPRRRAAHTVRASHARWRTATSTSAHAKLRMATAAGSMRGRGRRLAVNVAEQMSSGGTL